MNKTNLNGLQYNFTPNYEVSVYRIALCAFDPIANNQWLKYPFIW
ncbi:MAG: hypothetical protein AAGF87_02815 [Bacteroidota bacterium]